MIIEDDFSYFTLKPNVVTPLMNHLVETVQMRGHNIGFYAELTKFIPNYTCITKYSLLSRTLSNVRIT